jgi:hypothetical protein
MKADIQIIQLAAAGGMTGGRHGGTFIAPQPAMISLGGVYWTSSVPQNQEQSNHINEVCTMLVTTKIGQ